MAELIRKFGSRNYAQVDTTDIRPKDVVSFQDNGLHTRNVISVAKKTITVDQPKGFKPKTKRVLREKVTQVWRRHKNVGK